jgi:hypothetical protein
MQSAAAPQIFPVAQGGQAPPQSTSVSVPFLIASLQEGGAQTEASQTRLSQSPGEEHPFPRAHPGHPPPQSTSVSVPFLRPSAQEGAVQAPLAQTLEAQSVAAAQAF